MSNQPPNPYNANFFGGYGQERPPSLVDPNWNYNATAQPMNFGPQFQGPPQHPMQQFVPAPHVMGTRGPSRRASGFRPQRPRFMNQGAAAPKKVSLSKKDWVDKLEKDASTTLLEFRQATEEGGVAFSDELKGKLENAKVVGGDILNAICKAATSSELEGTIIGIGGVREDGGEPSLAEQVMEIEMIEKQGNE